MGDNILENVSSYGDLGIEVESTLGWTKHIKGKVSKANSTMGLIKRTVGFKAPQKVKQVLYNALVKSVLDYGSLIWSGTTRYNMSLIEGVQRRATKYILKDYTSTYNERLVKLKMIPLNYGFEISDLMFFYKCLHNMFDYNMRNIVSVVQNNRRSGNKITFEVKSAKTETYKSFYSNRIVELWNNLPIEIKSVQCTNRTASLFKSRLKKMYRQKTVTYFDTNNLCTWKTVCRCHLCRPD